MNGNEVEVGLEAVMLASTLSPCMYPYYSGAKVFSFLNKYTAEIKIENGLGILDPLSTNPVTFNEDNEDYDELFEIYVDRIDGDVSEEIKEISQEIYNHLCTQISTAYDTQISDLQLGFGVKNIEDEPKIYLNECMSCKIIRSPTWRLVEKVPDGVCIIAQLICLICGCQYPAERCFGSLDCLNSPMNRVTIGTAFRHYVYKIFFDCDTDTIIEYIRSRVQIINPDAIRNPVGFCPDCYHEWQCNESRRLKQLAIPRKSPSKSSPEKRKSTGQNALRMSGGFSISGKSLKRKSVMLTKPQTTSMFGMRQSGSGMLPHKAKLL